MKKVTSQISNTLLLMKRNPLRTFLTSLGIIVATMIYTIGIIFSNIIINRNNAFYSSFPKDSALIYDISRTDYNMLMNTYSDYTKGTYITKYKHFIDLKNGTKIDADIL